MRLPLSILLTGAASAAALVTWSGLLSAQQVGAPGAAIAAGDGADDSAATSLSVDAASGAPNPTHVLTAKQWRRVDAATRRALTWLAAEQERDGSFPSVEMGQPGVTGLCVLAFLSQGQMPGQGEYGERLERATGFIVGCQKENGLITRVGPEGPEISRNVVHEIGEAASYNHAISSLALSEVYGSTGGVQAARLSKAIDKSIQATLEMQRWPKHRAADRGGWRYLNSIREMDSDLSVTGWELMFLRSSRNAGFDVPKPAIDEAVAYVRRTYSERYGAFAYAVSENSDLRSRAMAGAGILALAHAGFHHAPEATQSGDWVLQYNFDRYNEFMPFTRVSSIDRYHYSLFNCCQGMYQLGGRYWEQFFPPVVETLLANQQADGSWPAESHFNDAQFGNCYTTALVLLTLGAPNQLLPIYQR
jgi:hypothetical protein